MLRVVLFWNRTGKAYFFPFLKLKKKKCCVFSKYPMRNSNVNRKWSLYAKNIWNIRIIFSSIFFFGFFHSCMDSYLLIAEWDSTYIFSLCYSVVIGCWASAFHERITKDVFQKNNLFIFNLAGSSLLHGLFPHSEQGLLSRCSAWTSCCSGFFCCGAEAVGCLGFGSCSTWG